MKRSGPPKRKTRLRSHRQPREPRSEIAGVWRRQVLAERRCLVCGQPGTRTDPLEAHHVLEARALKRAVSAVVGLTREERDAMERKLLYDWRNGFAVHRSEHDLHTRAIKRIPLSLLQPRHWAFARELGLEWRLERFYA